MKNKSKKAHDNKIIYMIIISLLLIVIALSIFFQNIKKDTKQNKDTMKKIQTIYQILEENISTYNETRNNLVTNLENYYTENLEQDYVTFINLLTQEEDTISAIKTNIEELEKNCQDQIFSKKEINTICSSYPEYYEKVVNIFINDKNQFNNIIRIYNKTATKPLEEFYPTQNKDYIDYNKDGKFLEREEE